MWRFAPGLARQVPCGSFSAFFIALDNATMTG
jgi:hypothetical protein